MLEMPAAGASGLLKKHGLPQGRALVARMGAAIKSRSCAVLRKLEHYQFGQCDQLLRQCPEGATHRVDSEYAQRRVDFDAPAGTIWQPIGDSEVGHMGDYELLDIPVDEVQDKGDIGPAAQDEVGASRNQRAPRPPQRTGRNNHSQNGTWMHESEIPQRTEDPCSACH